MPGYPFLAKNPARLSDIAEHLKVNATVGVPYDADMIANAAKDAAAQANPDADGGDALIRRYPKAQIRDFDGNPESITEMDALIAYLQMLGTLVDFKSYRADGENLR